jgi:putative acetyltransferase
MGTYIIRRGGPADGDAIAATHLDSIWSLGVSAYAPEIVADWGAPRTGDRYREAMARGVAFFVAVAIPPVGDGGVLGFSSYAVEGDMHRTAVYVRGSAARQGLGRVLFGAAEQAAREGGAEMLAIEAALGAVPFWLAMGFEPVGPRDHVTRGGHHMPCLLMHKRLLDRIRVRDSTSSDQAPCDADN